LKILPPIQSKAGQIIEIGYEQQGIFISRVDHGYKGNGDQAADLPRKLRSKTKVGLLLKTDHDCCRLHVLQVI